MIDLHFHALPGIDDGPPDLDAAIALARAAAATGADAVVATPHVSWEWPNTAQTIAVAVRQLNGALASRSIRLRVYPGAEVALTRAFDMPESELRGLRLGAGPWMLIEAPHAPGVPAVEHALRHLQARGERIMLAHVERCPAFVEDGDLLSRLVKSGMLASITAGSLVGRFGPQAQRAAQLFLTSGLVHNVSSDAHNPTNRPPGVMRELEHAGLDAQASWLTHEVPVAILRGAAIPPAPPWPAPPTRRGFFSRGRR